MAIYVSVLFKSLFATLPAGPGYLKLEARRTFLKYSAWLVIHAKVLLCIEHQRISTSRFNTICSFFRSSITPHHPYLFAEASPLPEVWWGHCMTNWLKAFTKGRYSGKVGPGPRQKSDIHGFCSRLRPKAREGFTSKTCGSQRNPRPLLGFTTYFGCIDV